MMVGKEIGDRARQAWEAVVRIWVCVLRKCEATGGF